MWGGLGNHPLFQTKTIFPKTFLVFVTKICFNKENDQNSLICFENFNIFGHFFHWRLMKFYPQNLTLNSKP